MLLTNRIYEPMAYGSRLLDGSYWRETVPHPPDWPTLEGEARSECAIVGAGYTGLNAALDLARAGADVAVLEAETPGCGCKPGPSIKLATNSRMYPRMSEDTDINCGGVISENVPLKQMGETIFRRIPEVASGDRSKSEAFGFGDNEFDPWVVGAVM